MCVCVCVCVCVCECEKEKRADTISGSHYILWKFHSLLTLPKRTTMAIHLYTDTVFVLSTLSAYLSCTLDFSRVSISCLYFLWSLSDSCRVSITPRSLLQGVCKWQWNLWVYVISVCWCIMYIVCVCVCVWEREREREIECGVHVWCYISLKVKSRSNPTS